MWKLNYKESWALKNWCFWTVVLEKTLESPLDCKEIQSVHPKENQSWVFIGRTDAEAETPMLCPPDVKSWLIWKDPDAGKDWGHEEKGMTEDEMVGWHHRLNGHKLVCVSSGSWWWTGTSGMLQSKESQRVGHDSATELKPNLKKIISTSISSVAQQRKDQWTWNQYNTNVTWFQKKYYIREREKCIHLWKSRKQ